MVVLRHLVVEFLPFVFLIFSVSSQSDDAGVGSSERCINDCVTPEICLPWQFSRRGKDYFPYCCYDGRQRRRGHRNSQREKKLDCRFRRFENFVTTEAAPDVHSLDLSFNDFNGKAQQLHDNFLQHFHHLQKLTISTSQLSNLTTNFLSSNRALKQLTLAWNSITELPEDLLAENGDLVRIDLSGNDISILPKTIFRNNPNVEEIVLSYNKLKYLTSEHFAPVPKLRSLDLFRNPKLECISLTVLFTNNNNLSYLRLEDTGYHVPIWMQKTFCVSRCRNTITYLKWKLRIYFPGGTEYKPGHPCYDPKPLKYPPQ